MHDFASADTKTGLHGRRVPTLRRALWDVLVLSKYRRNLGVDVTASRRDSGTLVFSTLDVFTEEFGCFGVLQDEVDNPGALFNDAVPGIVDVCVFAVSGGQSVVVALSDKHPGQRGSDTDDVPLCADANLSWPGRVDEAAHQTDGIADFLTDVMPRTVAVDEASGCDLSRVQPGTSDATVSDPPPCVEVGGLRCIDPQSQLGRRTAVVPVEVARDQGALGGRASVY